MRFTLLVLMALKLLDSFGEANLFEKLLAKGNEHFVSVFEELLSYPLANEKILLVLDPKLLLRMNIDDVFKALGQAESYCIVTWDTSFSDAGLPRAFIRGSYMTTIVLFESDPTSFLERENLSWQWNPDHIILFNLNPDLESKEISLHPLVQRTKFIVNISPAVKESDAYSLHQVLHNGFERKDKNFNLYRSAGIWNKTRFNKKSDLFKWNDSNFGGAIIKLASFCADFPFMYVKQSAFDYMYPPSECVGAALDILDIIGNKLNFTYEIQMFPPDSKWGSLENGIWNGMLGDLAYHNKSLLINNMLLTEDRNLAFDASYPYFAEGFNFIIRIPKPAPKWRGLLYSFTSFVWMGFVIATTVAAAVLALMLKASPDLESYETVPLVIFSALTRQSYPVRMRAAWMHQWMVWWWWSCFIITAAYTSNLVAFLTVTVPNKRIETLNELAASNMKYEICSLVRLLIIYVAL